MITKRLSPILLAGGLLLNLAACQNTHGPTASHGLEDPTVEQRKNLATGTSSNTTKLMKTLHDYQATTLLGETFDMAALKGKRVLIVNTASECGFTPQYEGLQELYEKHGGKDFTIIGFPSNDFGQQEPGSNKDIKAFCEKNYGVTFPMMAKTAVTGPDKHPVYAWLTDKDLNGVADAQVSWNFNKFLVDVNGNWIAHYPSQVKPLDPAIVSFARGDRQ